MGRTWNLVGGYAPYDGTVEFYGRLQMLLDPDAWILDLGAGRGAWAGEDQCEWKRSLRSWRGKVSEVIGADVDPVVLENPTTDRNVLIVDGRVQDVADGTVDVIVSDYVLEHIEDVPALRREADRMLRPGGWFCARTPHRNHYVSLGARLIRNASHARLLRTIQPDRRAEDVFPTFYRCNTMKDLRRNFADYENFSYLYVSEPQYDFGRDIVFGGLSLLQRITPDVFSANLFIFLRKLA